METLKCQHVVHTTKPFCLMCGSYVSKTIHLTALKSSRFKASYESTDNQELFRLKNQMSTIKIIRNKQISDEMAELIGQISDNYTWSLKTQSIGIFFYLYYCSKYGLPLSSQTFKYAAICLYIGAKVQQHTQLKGLKKFRKFCNKCFSLQQYSNIQSEILEDFNFDLNVLTFVDLINYYLIKGIVFSNERCNVEKTQNKVLSLSKMFLRKGIFSFLDQQKLAVFIIYQSRFDSKFIQIWVRGIEQYTEIKLQEIKKINKQNNGQRRTCNLPSTPKGILQNRNCIY